MNILGLSSYPVQSAATRFRLVQYIEPLEEFGIKLTLKPFLNSDQYADLYAGGGVVGKALRIMPSLLKRIGEIFTSGSYDLVFIQREALFFGPALFERIFRTFGRRPMVLDLDDATYISYVSPTYGRAASLLKFFGKTDSLIKQADLVVCGNRFIAEYVESKGSRSVVIPTIADPNIFHPIEKDPAALPVVGWVGTHSTYPFLRKLFPVISELSKKHEFVFKVIGAETKIEDSGCANLVQEKWTMAREAEHFQSLDIGLYPINVTETAKKEWLQGKSGFKAIQYLAVGIPFVMSPIGVCAEIGVPGETHFNAETETEWHDAIDKLLSDKELRQQMGANDRRHSLEFYDVPMHTAALAKAFQDTLGQKI